MKVKPFLMLAAVWAAVSCTSLSAQYTGGGGGLIRSATFGDSSGLGVIPVAKKRSSLSDLPASTGVASGCAGAGCADGSCGVSCSDPAGCAGCGDIGCACKPCGCPQCLPCGCGPCGWTHKVGVFGEFLYLRGRNLEVPYAVEQDSNQPFNQVAPVQVSRLGIVDPDFEPAYRVGASISNGTCSSFTLQYTMFESATTDDLTLQTTGNDIIGLVFHPGAQQTNSGGVFAESFYDISFDLIDADYRELISYGPCHKINYLIGTGYASLEQQFGATVAVNGAESVLTDIDFDGLGLRLGLEAERYSRCRRFLWYGRGITSLMAGEFRAAFQETDQFDDSIVDTSWTGGRIVPIVNIETGVGINLADGAYRLTAGYTYNTWFNTVKTQDWIRSVQTSDFTSLSDAMTFDGAVARFEARF